VLLISKYTHWGRIKKGCIRAFCIQRFISGKGRVFPSSQRRFGPFAARSPTRFFLCPWLDRSVCSTRPTCWLFPQYSAWFHQSRAIYPSFPPPVLEPRQLWTATPRWLSLFRPERCSDRPAWVIYDLVSAGNIYGIVEVAPIDYTFWTAHRSLYYISGVSKRNFGIECKSSWSVIYELWYWSCNMRSSTEISGKTSSAFRICFSWRYDWQ